MTTCDRFEFEGLVRFVAGEPLDAHLQSCADCQAALTSYKKVTAALRQAEDAHSPPGDWEAKVWSKISSAQAARPRTPWAVVLGLGTTLAALGVLFLNFAGGPDSLALTTQTLERGPGAVVRGIAAPGDVLHLVAQVPRGKLGDLRVYRGPGELVFQCTTSPVCIRSRDHLEAKVALNRAGTYRVLLVGADKVLPAATGSVDADYAAAIRSGEAQESAPIEVL